MRQTVQIVLPMIAIAYIATVTGCGPRRPPSELQQEDVETLPVRPEWEQFASEGYRGVVLAELHAPFNAWFPDPPRVMAARNRSRGTTELLASGQVDVADSNGTKLRRPFVVRWRQLGSGWEVSEVHVEGPGQPVPAAPSEAPTGPRPPTSRPAAAATAPAEAGA